jgi:tetratricopeptide (TPR) repeat protein
LLRFGHVVEGATCAMKNEWKILAAMCAVVIGVYAISARSGHVTSSSLDPSDEYYNLLVQGFRADQLNLKKDVPPGLAQLKDPYDPTANASLPVLDISYYKGKLYLYYGVAPAVLLFWPYAALTGNYLSQKNAALIFCVVGFLVSSALLLAIRRRYFTEVSTWVAAAGVLLLGLTTCAPALLARSDVWEVVVSCANAFTMITIGALWWACQVPCQRSRWLAVASLAYGLAVGARPNLVFGAVILLIPVFQAWQKERRILCPLIAVVGPIAIIGCGLMLYNKLRFDSPFEFGLRYALSPDADLKSASQRFGLQYLWFHVRVYFLAAPGWYRGFPFVHDVALPPLPRGHGDIEHPFGILTNIPILCLALAVPLAWRDRSEEVRSTLSRFLMSVVILFGINAVTLALFFSASIRYEMEFLPALALLAVVGILSLERALAGCVAWRGTARCVWILLLSFSIAFNLSVSFVRRADAENRLGMILLKEGRVREAVERCQQAVYWKPNYAEAHNNLGATLMKEGRVQEAIQEYQRALALKPNFAAASNNLADGLIAQGRAQEAIDVYKRALQIQPDAQLYNNLGAILMTQGRVQEAAEQYHQALRLNPDVASTHYNLGLALASIGGIDDAMKEWEEAIRLNPNDAPAHYNLGSALERQGRTAEAIAEFQQALKLRPDYLPAKNALTRLGVGQ